MVNKFQWLATMSSEHQDPFWLVRMVNEFPWKRILPRFAPMLLHSCDEHVDFREVLANQWLNVEVEPIGTARWGVAIVELN
jgi:hypothetical protein